MPSSDLPEEGPITTENYLRDKAARGSISPKTPNAPTALDTASNTKLAVPGPNEQGLLAPSQRNKLLRGVLWQILPMFVVIFGIARLSHSKGYGTELDLPIAVTIASIGTLAFQLFNSGLLVLDILRGKVRRSDGYWSFRTEGSGKGKRTIHSIGGKDVRLNIFMHLRFDVGPFSESAQYVVYYLPTSRIIVSYYPFSTTGLYAQGYHAGKYKADGEIFLAALSLLALLVMAFLLVPSFVTPVSTSANNSSRLIVPFSTSTYSPPLTRTPIVPVAKVLRTFSGHSRLVDSVAFSPDGKTIITGSADNTAILWDTATGQKLRPFRGGVDQVNTVAFSPDGKAILTGSSGNLVVLWDETNGQTLRTFEGHTDIVNSVAFSPDGKIAASASRDTTVILWDVATGNKLRTFTHSSAVTSVAFSPDGKQILTGCKATTAILWDVASGNKLRTLSGHTSTVNAVAFSPDGGEILTGSRDDTAILWNAVTGKQLQTFTGHRSDVKSVAFAPDGKTILTGSDDKTAILWDAATGSKLGIVLYQPSAAINSVAFSPDGRTILTGSDDYMAKLWDISDLVGTAPAATP